MPATFQKTIDKTLEGIESKFAFLDDILVITKGTINEHENELDKILSKLDKENLAINLQNREFGKKHSRMARFQNNSPGNNPINYKNGSHNETRSPRNSKTTPFLHGEHTSPYKIHSQIGRNYRTAQTTTKENRKQKQSTKLE